MDGAPGRLCPAGHGQPSGVQLVSVDGDGRPAPDRAGPTGLAKRSIGAMRGAVCVLGLPDAVSGVNVAEGLADVLALAPRLPWPAICTGGSGGFAAVARASPCPCQRGSLSPPSRADRPAHTHTGPSGRLIFFSRVRSARAS